MSAEASSAPVGFPQDFHSLGSLQGILGGWECLRTSEISLAGVVWIMDGDTLIHKWRYKPLRTNSKWSRLTYAKVSPHLFQKDSLSSVHLQDQAGMIRFDLFWYSPTIGSLGILCWWNTFIIWAYCHSQTLKPTHSPHLNLMFWYWFPDPNHKLAIFIEQYWTLIDCSSSSPPPLKTTISQLFYRLTNLYAWPKNIIQPPVPLPQPQPQPQPQPTP